MSNKTVLDPAVEASLPHRHGEERSDAAIEIVAIASGG
jgi:hypothetical protein